MGSFGPMKVDASRPEMIAGPPFRYGPNPDTLLDVSDLVFIDAARASIVSRRGIEGPPDLAIEILSSWSVRRDRIAKAALYARYGIRHYWVMDPDARTLEIYEADGAQYRSVERHEGHATVRTAVFPDLEIDLGRVWI